MKFFLYTWYFFRSVFLRGFVNTLRFLRAEAVYDKKLGIKTTTIKKSDSSEFYHYQGAGYFALFKILSTVFKETGDLAFFDIGCGKGRAIFAAEFCGYNNLLGIELDPELVGIANDNLKSYALKRAGSHIHFVTANALDQHYGTAPAVYFFFNPFSETIMRRILDKITASTNAPTWFIYMNPLYKQPFSEKNMRLVKTFKTGRYTEAVVYALAGK